MSRFFSNLHIDRLSFWIGFLGGILFWWVIARIRQVIPQVIKSIKSIAKASRKGARASIEFQLHKEILTQAQSLHLASPLFPLDNILIQPKFLAPPTPIEPGVLPPYEDITCEAIPYLPDWTELAATYGAPTLSLEEALLGNANLIITGNSGSGKSTALADLASRLARHEIQGATIGESLPLLVHVADLSFHQENTDDVLELLIKLLFNSISSRIQNRLPKLITEYAVEGRLLLLLDGLDELPPSTFDETVSFLSLLIQQYPSIKIVTTASNQYLGNLPRLGFIPIPILAWNERQKQDFIQKWDRAYQEYLVDTSQRYEINVDLINAWLIVDKTINSPLDITLKAWAAYTGDVIGFLTLDAIESYILRLTSDISNSRPAMEQIALTMVNNDAPFINKDDPRLDEGIENFLSSLMGQRETESSIEASLTLPKPVKGSRIVPALIDRGLVRAHSNSKISFAHPVFTSYFASIALKSISDIIEITDLADWEGNFQWTTKSETLNFLLARKNAPQLVSEIITRSSDPLQKELFTISRWLRNLDDRFTWQNIVLKNLLNILQNDRYTILQKSKAITALATSNCPGINTLFEQMVASPNPNICKLGILGFGIIKDIKIQEALVKHLNDPLQGIHQAACLAMVAIGSKSAIDAVASALLNGTDDIRRAAAEALANNEEEGYPLLKEGATLEDILVRRAVIFGLRRIKHPWSIEILKKLQIEDAQWVVKNAADQALEEVEKPHPRIPRQLKDLSEFPWLIAFAGEKGMGLAPGKSAMDMVVSALKEGKEEQKLAALDTIRLLGKSDLFDLVVQTFHSTKGALKEAAYNTLWQISLMEKFPTQSSELM